MALSNRENYLRNASMQGHEWIPASVCISGGYWHAYREAAEDVCLKHPILFPGFEKGKTDFDAFARAEKDKQVVDAWGCTWYYELPGLDGIVTGHPLDDWAKFDAWQPPQPGEFTDDDRKRLDEQKERGELTSAGTEHGFCFMKLHYLRGYENFMLDIASEDPMLDKLIEVIASHHEARFRPYAEAGIDLFSAADDLGTQTNSIIGPRHFRKYILPTYKRIFGPFREGGAHVFMHSDGYIMDIVDLMIESGISIVNPQDLVNGIDEIARHIKGRVAIMCDIVRQSVVPFGSPQDVYDLVKEEVMKLGSPRGGLKFVVGIYAPTPPENLDALCRALEDYRTYWVGR